MRRALLLLLALLASASSAAELHDLRGVDDFARRFDAAHGRPRLVLLLSPT